jgi:CubicO group peptidase (beta-lactamase class C family)
MTRNQIPGISARSGDEFFPEASWGLGWSLPADKRGLCSGTLQSAKTVHHSGAGGTYLWVDPAYELVGVYFEVAPSFASPPKCRSLFMNAVTAAIVDG